MVRKTRPLITRRMAIKDPRPLMTNARPHVRSIMGPLRAISSGHDLALYGLGMGSKHPRLRDHLAIGYLVGERQSSNQAQLVGCRASGQGERLSRLKSYIGIIQPKLDSFLFHPSDRFQ